MLLVLRVRRDAARVGRDHAHGGSMLRARFGFGAARVAGGLLVLAALAAADPAALTQVAASVRPVKLVNGDMEDVDGEGKLAGWRVPAALLDAGYVIGPEFDDVFRGAGAARIDSREVTAGGNLFGNLSQSLDAKPYQGKRVRYRAAVKVSEAQAVGQAQMWLRVDLAGGANRVGFFDNMGDRPIQAGEWKTY